VHFYAWKKGLKTGMYYLRTKAATDAIKFTVDAKALREEADGKNDVDEETAVDARSPPLQSGDGKKLPATPQRVKKAREAALSPNRKKAMTATTAMLGGEQVKVDMTAGAGDDIGPKDIDAWRKNRQKMKDREAMICSLENKDECMSCGS
jgi:ribonucleotide reductase alpha subunit